MRNTLLVFLFSFVSLDSYAQHQEWKSVDVNQYKLIPQSSSIKGSDGVLVTLFDETGTKLLLGGLDKKIACFDIISGKELWSVAGENIEPNAAADMYSLDVPFLAVGNNMFSGGGINVYSWDSGEMLGSLAPFARGMHSLTYAPSGEIFWFGPGGSLFGYSIVRNAFVTSNAGMPGHVNDGNTVRVGPYENVYSVGVDGQFLKWENRFDSDTKTVNYTGEVDAIFKAERPLMSLALNKYIKNSEDAKASRIYAAIGENKGLIRVFSLSGRKAGEVAQTITSIQIEDGYVSNLAFHTTDPNLLIASGKRALNFYDFKTGKVLRSIEMPADVKGFDLTIDGTKIVVGLMTGEVRIYSL